MFLDGSSAKLNLTVKTNAEILSKATASHHDHGLQVTVATPESEKPHRIRWKHETMKTPPLVISFEMPTSDRRVKGLCTDILRFSLEVYDQSDIGNIAKLIWSLFSLNKSVPCHLLRTFDTAERTRKQLCDLGFTVGAEQDPIDFMVETSEQLEMLLGLDISETISFLPLNSPKLRAERGLEEDLLKSIAAVNKVAFFAPSHRSVEIFATAGSAEVIIRAGLAAYER